MDCERYESDIAALVEGTIELTARRGVEAHLATCSRCAALVDDLLLIRRSARALPPLTPPPGVWPRLAAAVQLTDSRPSRRRWRTGLGPLAAAAVLVVAVAAGITWWRDRSSAPPPAETATATTAPPADALLSVEDELRLAEQHYENAITRLEALAADQQMLDPTVAAELHKNLRVIDQAIGESRVALRAQPTSEPAQESLFDAFRSKIALLQDTIALINEMRKGDQAGAARVAGSLDKS
jgi:Putative zinc-finger